MIRMTTVVLAALVVAGCDSDNDVQELRNRFAIAANNVASVAIVDAPEVIELSTPTSLTLTADGGTENFASQASWSSGDTTVATVSDSGVVTGIADGTVTIQGTLGPFPASVDIRVSSAPLTDIIIATPDPINECGSAVVTAEGLYAADNNSLRNLNDWVWAVSNTPTIGVFSSETNGLFRSSANGTATITATRGGVTREAILTVKDNLQSIVITPTDPVVTTTSGLQFTATAVYDDVADQPEITDNVSWSVSNTSIARVDNTLPGKGTVTASTTGEVTLTAVCSESAALVEEEVRFSVGDPSIVISIEFQRGNTFNLEYEGIERTIQLNAMANLQDGTSVNINEDVNWSLVRRDTPLLSISNSDGSEGELTIRGTGRITIEIEYDTDSDRFDEDDSTFNTERITIDVF